MYLRALLFFRCVLGPDKHDAEGGYRVEGFRCVSEAVQIQR